MISHSDFIQERNLLRFKQSAAYLKKGIQEYATRCPSCLGRYGLLLWVPFLIFAVASQAKADLSVAIRNKTLEIKGSNSPDSVSIWFNRAPKDNVHGPEFVHITSGDGIVNGARQAIRIKLSEFNHIRVLTYGENDGVSFHLRTQPTTWKGDVTIDYGKRSSLSKINEKLHFEKNLAFRNFSVSVSDPKKLNVTGRDLVTIDSFRINNVPQ